jgi:hypothetical protein
MSGTWELFALKEHPPPLKKKTWVKKNPPFPHHKKKERGTFTP